MLCSSDLSRSHMCFQSESLTQENEQLKEKVEELMVDLQIIKEEIATAGDDNK